MTTGDEQEPGSVGMSAALRFAVTAADTAASLGSGSLPVLGTPRLLAWCEAATCAAIEPGLDSGATTVGVAVRLEHQRASPVGQRLEVTALVTSVEGRLHRFAVHARHLPDGPVVASGEVTRVVVDAERFLAQFDR